MRSNTSSRWTRSIKELEDWQNGRCAVCGVRSALIIDHDHESGLVRGLLCKGCNVREGQGSGSRYGDIVKYRQRPPVEILCIEIEYVNPRTGRPAEDRRLKTPWGNSPLGPCQWCCASPLETCKCPPIFRLSPFKVIHSIYRLYDIAQHARLKDARGLYQRYLEENVKTAEDFLVRDLLFPPSTQGFMRRWGTTGGSPLARSYPLSRELRRLTSPLDGPCGDSIMSTQDIGNLVRALSFVIDVAHQNSCDIILPTCTELIMGCGTALSDSAIESEKLAHIPMKILSRVESILNFTVRRIEDTHWNIDVEAAINIGIEDPVNDVAQLLREDSKRARITLERTQSQVY